MSKPVNSQKAAFEGVLFLIGFSIVFVATTLAYVWVFWTVAIVGLRLNFSGESTGLMIIIFVAGWSVPMYLLSVVLKKSIERSEK